MQSNAKNVDAYMMEVPAERAAALERLRALCLETLEGFEESMEYGMPSYSRGDEVEVAFASQKNYISLYILKQDVFEASRPRLDGLNLGKGCIRYSKPEKIDFSVVRDMLEATRESTAPIC